MASRGRYKHSSNLRILRVISVVSTFSEGLRGTLFRLIPRRKPPQTQIFHPEIKTKQYGKPEGKSPKICWGFFFSA